MCGITARVGPGAGTRELVDCLENLEYRGYDSAGIAVRAGDGLVVHKREGQIAALKRDLDGRLPEATVGIGHTRWSTHGAPTDANAHPHTDCADRVALVHNGIIENHEALREALVDAGHRFTSETDSEVVAHLVEEELNGGRSPERAFRRAIEALEGSFALAMLVSGVDAVFAVRRGSPLVLGEREGTTYLASDVTAFLEYADRAVYLEDGDVAVVSADGYRLTTLDGAPVHRPAEALEWRAADATKTGYDHFMLKEINEQPEALAGTIADRLAADGSDVDLPAFPPGSFDGVRSVQLVACGTSYHAAMYGRHLLARRGVPAQVFRAGEYATDPDPVDASTLVIGVTQSGETADTLASLRRAAEGGARTLALTNVVGSTAARACDDAFLIRAGPEIGVAATKTFSSQVASLVLLGERLVRDVTGRPSDDADALLAGLRELPGTVRRVLDTSTAPAVCDRYGGADAYFFIGRGVVHSVALEGALKCKEITYEHAEGFAAGQLKHGPLALVTERTPVFAVFSGQHDRKTANNVEEVRARGAPVVAVASEAAGAVARVADDVLPYPDTYPPLAGIPANVQLQLVAYHLANQLGRNIDKPRHLAKSVTVE